jgi:hypothetical protein
MKRSTLGLINARSKFGQDLFAAAQSPFEDFNSRLYVFIGHILKSVSTPLRFKLRKTFLSSAFHVSTRKMKYKSSALVHSTSDWSWLGHPQLRSFPLPARFITYASEHSLSRSLRSSQPSAFISIQRGAGMGSSLSHSMLITLSPGTYSPADLAASATVWTSWPGKRHSNRILPRCPSWFLASAVCLLSLASSHSSPSIWRAVSADPFLGRHDALLKPIDNLPAIHGVLCLVATVILRTIADRKTFTSSRGIGIFKPADATLDLPHWPTALSSLPRRSSSSVTSSVLT